MQILGRDLIAALGVISLILIVFCQASRAKENKAVQVTGAVIFTVYMLVMFSVTGISPMSGFHTDLRWDEIQLIPFFGIIDIMKCGVGMAITNILGNILMFVPLGFFVPLLWNRFRSKKRMVIFGAVISTLIECSQLFLIRCTDIDDVILNTLGTFCGYLIFEVVFRWIEQRKEAHALFLGQTQKSIWRVLPFTCIAISYLTVVLNGFFDRAQFLQ